MARHQRALVPRSRFRRVGDPRVRRPPAVRPGDPDERCRCNRSRQRGILVEVSIEFARPGDGADRDLADNAAARAARGYAMTTSPLLTLNNGIKMPALGFGTLDRTEPERIAGAVEAAIAAGYRLVDTAASYAVERQVGEGIQRSGIARSELFVTTKLWISDYGYERALRACETSLRKLGLEYLDLYLLHWPVPSDFDATVASFRAAEKLLADGRVRAIGVSNFNSKHIQNLIERTRVLPRSIRSNCIRSSSSGRRETP